MMLGNISFGFFIEGKNTVTNYILIDLLATFLPSF